MKKNVSLILTVHNKDFLMERVVGGLLANASRDVRELIAVFDGCTDDSERIFDATVAAAGPGKIDIIKLATADIWETRANNVGLKQSTCDFSVIIQDDMVVREKDFDLRLKKPLQHFDDVFAVTARTAHNDIIREGRLCFTDDIGRENPGGKRQGKRLKKMRKFLRIPQRMRRDLFGVRDVVNRGPLMLDNERLQKLDYLDEAFAPLDLDDHDLCFRAFRDHGWVCGSYVVAYDSDLDWGQTRRNENSRRIWQQSHAKNEKILLERHREAMRGPKHNENRVLR